MSEKSSCENEQSHGRENLVPRERNAEMSMQNLVAISTVAQEMGIDSE
jgi:hypothetical protein